MEKNELTFEEMLQAEINKLPYTKHVDDGQYNDGVCYGFEIGARWASSQFKSSEREQQAINLIERCEKTFGKLNDIITILKENSDSRDLSKLVDAIDVDIPQVQAIIKDELTNLKK